MHFYFVLLFYILSIETFSTDLTFMRPIKEILEIILPEFLVSSLVVPQIAMGGEGLFAKFALVRLLPSVSSLVNYQVWILDKSLIASFKFAGEWSDSFMTQQV